MSKARPCVLCGQRMGNDGVHFGDVGTFYQGKRLCETCYYESEPIATLYYGTCDTPNIISETRNETDGAFVAKWHSTDPWRGYYEVASSPYVMINEAESLAWHESQEMLRKFAETARILFEKHSINYVKAFARTSNLFCQTFYLFVDRTQALSGSLLVAEAKKKVGYDDPQWQKNVLFDAETLSKLSKLFPEDGIKTDEDALKLAEKHGENLIPELVARLGKLGKEGGQQ